MTPDHPQASASNPPKTKVFKGVGVSPGFGLGRLFLLPDTSALAGRAPRTSDAAGEILRYRTAREEVWERFRQAAEHLVRELGGKEGGSLDVYALILKDQGINQEIELLIESGLTAAVAVETVFQKLAARQKSVKNDYLRERATVWRDVSKQLVTELLGLHSLDAARGKDPVIVAARELTPFALVNPPENIKGFARELGGPTDHASILARAYKIPMVLGLSGLTRAAKAGDPAMIDGSSGELTLHPDAGLVEARRPKGPAVGLVIPGGGPDARPAETQDGRRIALLANLETSHGLAALSRYGPEGVGLFRSEFLFLRRSEAPTEEEQSHEFGRAAEAFFPRRVTIRAADFGADKLPAYLAAPDLPGACAGLRGIRFLLAREEIFLPHLRAVLRASARGNLKLMFPLVPGLETLRRAKALVRSAMKALAAESVPFDAGLPLGVMIEVPSAAIMAGGLAREADFFSIGTNDLIQYTLGMDRDQAFLAGEGRFIPPSVIQLIQSVVNSARPRQRPVAVCGELASQPWAIPLLVGLGVDELSMAASHIPRAKEVVRGLSYARCCGLAKRALELETPTEIRALLAACEARP